MEGYNKYAALADTIKIEDITSNKQNQTILRQLKENDPHLEPMNLYCSTDEADNNNTIDYIPDKDEDIGWLGYFIGQCTTLKELHFCNNINKHFYRQMRCNKSIQTVCFYGCSGMNPIEEEMTFFFRTNHNLTRIYMQDCRMEAEGVRQLEIAIGGCSKSLKQLSLVDTERYEDGGGGPANIDFANVITAIGTHTQLEELDLRNECIGSFCREEFTALAFTIRCLTNLRKLNLFMNEIDDEGIETLVDSLSDAGNLRELNLAANQRITIDGWMDVATILEMFDSKLEKLDVSLNYIGDGGAYTFANALSINSTLKTLGLQCNGITRRGWEFFSKLLCDTSSVNNTYLSNHTLLDLTSEQSFLQGPIHNLPPAVHSYLALNRSTRDREKVAMAKILLNHSHFNVQPFFEWELKVLPLMIGWFTRAVTFSFTFTIGEIAYSMCPEKIKKMKLSVIYDFIKEFPMLYIEPVTRQEIEDCTALEGELMNQSSEGDKETRLEEIRRHKARAMRRLH